MDLCISCKGCKAECPSSVDMAKIKAEVLQAYYDKKGVPLRVQMMGRIAQINRLSAPVAPIVNWTLGNSLVRSLLDRFLRGRQAKEAPSPRDAHLRGVVQEPAFRTKRGRRAGKSPVPERHVHELQLPRNRQGRGQGAGGGGLRGRAGGDGLLRAAHDIARPLKREGQKLAQENIAKLAPAIEAGLPIIGVEPSCLLTFRDEYPDLVAGDAAQKPGGEFLHARGISPESAR